MMTKMPLIIPREADKYDAAIKFLQENPNEIVPAWNNMLSHPAGCLFDIVPGIGVCLTQIRKGMGSPDTPFESWSQPYSRAKALTQRIESDERIPVDQNKITLDMLPMFAEYQREFEPLRGAADSTGAIGAEND